MKILDQQRQGEVLFIQVDEFPLDKEEYQSATPENGMLVVAHSETGHHHVIDRPKQADLLIGKVNKFIGRLIAKEDCEVKHLRSFDTHKTLNLPKGKYILRYRKEYTPEGLRRVMD